MLYNLLVPFAEDYTVLNLFRYITFRSGAAFMTALIISFLIAPSVIRWLKSKQGSGQPIRKDGPETHLKKAGTPTMGGLMILISVLISCFLWADLNNSYIWISLGVFTGYGAIGFIDDYLKLTKKNTAGLSAKVRLIGQAVIAGIAAYFTVAVSQNAELADVLTFPFFKNVVVDLGWFFIPFALFVVVGAANAVNFTDGLDGLAIGPIMIAAGCFGVITYLVGNAVFSNYLQIHYVAGSGELSIICSALIGAGLGFLWYNAPPASIFMGDVGSLSMGGLLGIFSVITKHEIVLAIIGGLFVIETVSVILQVGSFKLRGGKRVFKMAPIHHHFEKEGWPETKVVFRFWILAVIFALIGLATLKLR